MEKTDETKPDHFNIVFFKLISWLSCVTNNWNHKGFLITKSVPSLNTSNLEQTCLSWDKRLLSFTHGGLFMKHCVACVSNCCYIKPCSTLFLCSEVFFALIYESSFIIGGGEQWSSKENHLSQISSFSDRRRRIILATDCQCWVLCPEGGQLPGSKRQPMLGFMSHRRAPQIPHAREYSTPKKDSQGWRLLRQLITDCMERIIWWTTCQHPLQYDMPDTFIETSAAFTNRSKRRIISLSRCQEPVQEPLQWSILRPILCFTFHISRCSKCP